MANPRKPWAQLSPSYRRRLIAAGVTPRSHRKADLRAVRGHQPRPLGAAPKEATARYLRGEGTDADRRSLEQWRRPAWLPKSEIAMSNDTAAALSQIDLPPSRWREVTFLPATEDRPWTMVVKMKGNAYDRIIEIPGGGGPASGAREVIDWLSGEGLEYDVEGTT